MGDRPDPESRRKAGPDLVLTAVLDHDPQLILERPGLVIIGDEGYVSAELDQYPG